MRFWRSVVLQAWMLVVAITPAGAQTKPVVDKPVTVAAPALPGAAKAPKTKKPRTSRTTRRAWMFGVNLGYAATRFVGTWVPVTAERRTDTPVENPPLLTVNHHWTKTNFESSSAVQFRVGYALHPRLMVSLERLQWFKDFSQYSWHFSTSTLAATYYPGGGYYFVRAGAGLSGLAEKDPLTRPLFIEAADRGVSLEAAVGLERVLFGRVSITPEISVRQMNFGQNIRSQIVGGSVGLNWWF